MNVRCLFYCLRQPSYSTSKARQWFVKHRQAWIFFFFFFFIISYLYVTTLWNVFYILERQTCNHIVFGRKKLGFERNKKKPRKREGTEIETLFHLDRFLLSTNLCNDEDDTQIGREKERENETESIKYALNSSLKRAYHQTKFRNFNRRRCVEKKLKEAMEVGLTARGNQ